MTDDLTHLDDRGSVRMVDVSDKAVTPRRAVAEALVVMSQDVKARFLEGDLPKGDAAALVRIAVIQGCKRTSELVPLCHPLALDAVSVDLEQADEGIRVVVEPRVSARTGVEMEAMTGAAVGALAIYDMIKGLDRGAEIRAVRLLGKSGGKSGAWRRD